jgi:two-component system, LytTR family, response regulator
MINTKRHKCLIVDDEPIARKIIKTYLEQLPILEYAGECKNAFEAIETINADDSIEIIFLDINMPNITGVSMVKILSKKLQIIFTTAYSEYAIESYELNAVDYLLKPFLFERFAKAVYKALERLRDGSSFQTIKDASIIKNSIFIKSNGQNYPVLLDDVLYCEAMKNYTKVVLLNGKIYSPLIPLSKFEEELALSSLNFLRVHRSFVVSKKYVYSIGSNYVMIEKNKIPIGDQYKDHFLAQLGMK